MQECGSLAVLIVDLAGIGFGQRRVIRVSHFNIILICENNEVAAATLNHWLTDLHGLIAEVAVLIASAMECLQGQVDTNRHVTRDRCRGEGIQSQGTCRRIEAIVTRTKCVDAAFAFDHN